MQKMLFRFDDIHPYMNNEAFRSIISLSDICPESILLCVIPDNKDISLVHEKQPILSLIHI